MLSVLKPFSVLTLAAVSLASLVSACGGGGTPAGGAQEAPKEQGKAYLKEPVEITFYRPNTATTEEEFMKIMGDAVKAKFPNVTPKFIPYAKGTEFKDVIAAGEPLDIVFYSIGLITNMTDYDLQYDISGLMKTNKFDLSRLEQTQVEFMKNFSGGGMYGLPIFTTAEVLAYNKDIFDKFGVAYPKDGMTWDETYDLAKKLTRTDGGLQYYGFGMSASHMLNVNQLSAPFHDAQNKPLLTDDNFKKLIDNFARFYQLPGKDLSKELWSKQTSTLFTKDKTLAMYAYFNSTLNNDGNYDAVSLPYFKEAMGVGSQMYPTYATVASTSKHKEMAYEIVAYFTSDEFQTKFSKDGTGLTVLNDPEIRKTFAQSNPRYQGKNIKSFFPEKPAPITMKTKYSNIVSGKANTALQQVATGEKDAVTALREASEAAVKEIQAAQGK
ncbi:ABC transporter substrate-binding protein [Paenibacillus sp. GYB003]|uniref:ABC transporter substrate-binding protein n=1 Tax=Paenibacillus sp. GYB003 TaxID=2994392 RepID=UPI002F96843A